MKYRLPLTMAMILAIGSAHVAGRELPIRSFTAADGLADNRVNRIVLDSRGLLWICTNSGITRFDGSQFQSFGVPEGLPFPIINDLLETPDGDFWLASNGGGVIRLRLSSPERRYEAFLVDREPTANRVNRLFRTTDGAIWAGTDGGLFRMTAGAGGRPAFTRVGLRRRGVRSRRDAVGWHAVRADPLPAWRPHRFLSTEARVGNRSRLLPSLSV